MLTPKPDFIQQLIFLIKKFSLKFFFLNEILVITLLFIIKCHARHILGVMHIEMERMVLFGGVHLLVQESGDDKTSEFVGLF